ncbi:MAG: thiopurine S-methyltransferase [Nitrospinae bacterium]|nr:thiopurine S-methyltransferase [Nitrospinota bacterium]
MEPDFWHQRWQENQIGFHQETINAHLQAFWPGLGVPPGAAVFVPLCGKSFDMLWLRAQGHHVIGVELSGLAVNGFFSENRLQPTVAHEPGFKKYSADGVTIYCGDFFALTAAHLAAAGAMYDRASLIALPPAMRERYTDAIMEKLPTAARVALVTVEYDQGRMSGPPFAVAEDEVARLYSPRFKIAKLCEVEMTGEELEPFRKRGLTAMREKVYCLEGKGE